MRFALGTRRLSRSTLRLGPLKILHLLHVVLFHLRGLLRVALLHLSLLLLAGIFLLRLLMLALLLRLQLAVLLVLAIDERSLTLFALLFLGRTRAVTRRRRLVSRHIVCVVQFRRVRLVSSSCCSRRHYMLTREDARAGRSGNGGFAMIDRSA